MERNEIEDKYKWDLSVLFKDNKDVDSAITECEKAIEKIKKYENKLKDKISILSYFKESDSVDKLLSRICLFANRNFDVDIVNTENQKLMGKVSNLLNKYSVELSFIEPELAQLDDKLIDQMVADESFKDYDRILIKLKQEKVHTLDKSREKLMAGIGDFTDYSELFDKLSDVEMKFKPIKFPKGNTMELTNSNYGLFIKDEDKDVRLQAHLNLHNGYKDYNLTLSQNYISYLKKSDFVARTYNFNSKFESALFFEEVDESVYKTLIKNVHKSLNLYRRFISLKGKLLNLKEMGIQDVNAEIGDSSKFSLEYDEAVELVKKVTRQLGDEYSKIVDRNFNERWVDVYPSNGKVSGAYSASGGGANPFMLLNYNKSFREVSTIAHELGHSLHSYFSETYQPYAKQQYTIFVAEVASTVNEILLNKYVLKNEKDEKVKKSLINALLTEFSNTVFRQTMFSEFEFWAHDKINKREVLTAEDLNEKYSALQQYYFGNSLKLQECSKYEWSRIPHFYRAFYVYKYATGFISAVSICKHIEEEGENYVKNHYLKFLKGGCSLPPVELLKLAKVDITSDETYKSAFEFYDELIDLLNE